MFSLQLVHSVTNHSITIYKITQWTCNGLGSSGTVYEVIPFKYVLYLGFKFRTWPPEGAKSGTETQCDCLIQPHAVLGMFKAADLNDTISVYTDYQ